MQAEAISGRMDAVAAHPLAELLECPPEAGNLLNGSASASISMPGRLCFARTDVCKGLYVVVSGLFLRRAERLETRLTLGPARAGDLVELAAALGDGHHTYTLCAQTAGSLLLLPIEALNQAFRELSAAADAVAGGAGPRGFQSLSLLLPEPDSPCRRRRRSDRGSLDGRIGEALFPRRAFRRRRTIGD